MCENLRKLRHHFASLHYSTMTATHNLRISPKHKYGMDVMLGRSIYFFWNNYYQGHFETGHFATGRFEGLMFCKPDVLQT